jgi:uncharacterized protein YbaA (DUF1428 family)
MSYVDFVCIPIPETRVDEYKPVIEIFASMMKEYGLLSYCEALADDVQKGKKTDFYRAVNAEEGETVIAAFMKWPDKQTRDKAWDLGMKDPRMEKLGSSAMPFDGSRMFWGGFQTLFEF